MAVDGAAIYVEATVVLFQVYVVAPDAVNEDWLPRQTVAEAGAIPITGSEYVPITNVLVDTQF